MENELRYFKSSSGTIDLSKVDAISLGDLSYNERLQPLGYSYQVAMKSGAVIKLEGFGLNSQYKKYRGLDED